MLLAAGLLLYAWCVLFIAGNATLAFFSKKIVHTTILAHPSIIIIIGMCSVTALVSILHLWLPISASIHFIVLSILASYTVMQRAFVATSFVLWWLEVKQYPIGYFLLFIVAVISITARTGSGDIADYHLQGIKWAEQYNNIYGLGNFNKPLANNYWWFNIQAFFGLGFLGVSSVYVMNAILFTAVISYCHHKFSKGEFASFYLVLLCFMVLNINTAFIGAVTPDVCVNYIVFILFSIALDKSDRIDSLPIFMWIFAFIITVKITAIMLVVLVAVFLTQRKQFIIGHFTQWLGYGILLGSLFFIPWFAGNIINSGYLFPLFNQLDLFDVDWKIPSHFIIHEREIITEWSKIPTEQVEITKELTLAQWVPRWFVQYNLFNRGLIIASALGLLLFVGIIIWHLFKKVDVSKTNYFIIVLSAYAGLILLFFTSPQLRFMFGFLVVCIALVVQLLITNIRLPQKYIQLGLASLILVLLNTRIIALHNKYDLQSVIVTPPDYPKSKEITLENWNTEMIYTTNLNNTCWDQFPCTYYLLQGTRLRGNTLKGGFKNTTHRIN